MADRPLTAGEKALWQKLIETVEPLDPGRVRRVKALPVAKKLPEVRGPITTETFGGPPAKAIPLRQQVAVPEKAGLDGHWDRRLNKGVVQPDVTIDLHGYTLSSAHGRLDSALELSIAAGHRAILLITGKARSADQRQREGGRGAIRAAISDWLAASRHAPYIAAVRRAHPRHGGAGALYIILRRRRR
ncbi:Smr/MutS family protein [Parasphingorhabdus sp. JC815]|uniref:Smr/MutS family protein n=1 Tax=Parasphingorhabdus sp. JC815 TaxID=3232140 RepID=UPI00345ACB28